MCHAREREQPEYPRCYRTDISSIFAPRPAGENGGVNDLVLQLDILYVVDTSFFVSIGAVNPSLTAITNALRGAPLASAAPLSGCAPRRRSPASSRFS
jgi:hypothetical protein